jgi:hypothetical protein
VSERTLTLALHGEVSLDDFATAVQHWRGLIDSLTTNAAQGNEVHWVISELAASSAIMTARAEGAEEAVSLVSDDYLSLGRALASRSTPDFPREVLDDAYGLSGMINGSIDFIRFETADDDAIITSNFNVVIEAALTPEIGTPPPAAIGAVQGRIQTLTNRHGLRFTLFDSLYDKAVGCYLTEGQEEIMRDVWGRTAVVEGVVNRDPSSGRPLTIRHVRNVSGVDEVSPDAFRLARGAVALRDDDARSPEALIALARE